MHKVTSLFPPHHAFLYKKCRVNANKWHQDEGLIGITPRMYARPEMGHTYLIIRVRVREREGTTARYE